MKSPGGTKVRHSKFLLVKEFWRHSHGSRWLLAAITAGMLLDGLLQAALVNYLKILIDRLVVDPGAFVRNSLPGMVILGLSAGVVFFPVAYGGHLASSVLASRLVTSFRMSLYRHLQKLSMSFYHHNRSGEITSRLTQDVDNGVHILVGFLSSGSWSTAMLLTALLSMLFLSWKMTLVFCGLNLVYFLLWRRFRHHIGYRARNVRDQAGEVVAFATEDINSVVVMKSFARENHFFKRFREAQQRLYTAQVEAAQINHAFTDILQSVGKFIAPVALLGTGALLVERDGLTVGALVAFWSYWTLVQSPLNMLYGAGPGLASCFASMDRIHDFLVQVPTPDDQPGARYFQARQGEVEFNNVSFHYPGCAGNPIFNDLSFSIPAHTSLGVVGPSGAGKSTLVQLILRFYDPQSGSIALDGVDLRKMTQESLRRNTGVVLQESLLLSGTIRDNLLLGDEAARDDQIWVALEQAGAAEFVRDTGDGLDSMIGERGVTLSGGQRQRLCIARVFLKNPPLVIFDEATSALDTATEAMIRESMQRLLKGRTSILIAHRLSTITDCDRIMMIEDGVIQGLAPHSELLVSCPGYAELVNRQDSRLRMPDRGVALPAGG